MSEQRRVPVGIIASISTVLLAAGGATAYFTWQRSQAPKTPPTAVESPQPPVAVSPSPLPLPPSVAASPSPTAPSPSTAEKPTASTAGKPTAQVYTLRDRGADIELQASPVKVKSTDTPETAITAALNTLLTVPADKTSSAIPPGTKLRSVKVKSDGIYVDLSKEFGAGGGSLSMYSRVGQVLYTATSLMPEAPVFLMVEGKPLETLGGEGLIIDQPLTRRRFEQEGGQQRE